MEVILLYKRKVIDLHRIIPGLKLVIDQKLYALHFMSTLILTRF